MYLNTRNKAPFFLCGFKIKPALYSGGKHLFFNSAIFSKILFYFGSSLSFTLSKMVFMRSGNIKIIFSHYLDIKMGKDI